MNDERHHHTPRHEKVRFRRAEITDLSAMPSAAGHHGHWRGERRRRSAARLLLALLLGLMLIAVAGVAAGSFVFMSDWGAETLRQQAERAVRDFTAGKADASVGPSRLALGGNGAFGMRLTDIRLSRPQSGTPIARVDAIDFGVRLLPLLTGKLQVGSIVVAGGSIDLASLPKFDGHDWTVSLRNESGLLDPDLAVREVFKALYAAFQATDGGAADDIALSEVEVLFLQDGKQRRLHVESANVSRTGPDNVAITAELDYEGRGVKVTGSVGRNRRTGLVDALDLSIEGDAPIQEAEAARQPSAARVGRFTARLSGGDSADPQVARLALAAKVEESVLDFGARGTFRGNLEFDATLAEGSHKIELDRLLLRSERNIFDLNGAVGPRPASDARDAQPAYRFEMLSNRSVLAPAGSPEPALSFAAKIAGTYRPEAGVVETSQLEVRTASGAVLGGAQVTLLPGGAPGVAFSVSLRDMPVAEVKQLWPWFSAGKARSWVFDHLVGGRVAEADVEMRVAPGRLGDGVPLSAEEITGRFVVSDTRFDTFGSLPPIRDANGTVDVRGRDVDVTLASGTAFLPSGRSVAASNGILRFRNTAVPPVVGRLDIDIAGDAAAVAELASLPPINGPQRAGLAADDLTGTVTGHISSDVPLMKGVDPKSIDWKADLRFSALSVARPFGDQKLSGAEGTLALLPDRATIAAKGLLNGIRVSIAMVEPLRPEGPKRQRTVQLLFDDAARKLVAPALNQLMSGTAKIEIDEGNGERRVSADLSETKIDFPWIGWSKGAGVAASAQFTLVSAEGTTRLKDFELLGNSFALEGEMTLAGGALSEAKFSRVQLNRGDSARATITRSGNRYRVAVDGGALDARAIIKRYMSPGKSSGEGGDGGKSTVSVRAKLASATGFNGESLADVNLDYDGGGLSFSGITQSGQAVSAETAANRRLTVQSGDAGDLLRFLDLYKNVQGGSIKIAMAGTGEGATRGQIDARNFVVVNEPRLASVVSTAPAGSDRSLSQAASKEIDASRVSFERGYAQIERGTDYLKLANGVLRGPEIGATFQGTMYDARGRIDMTGTFMPAYGVNRIFGEIPLFGALLGNGRDRGLIGVTFKLEGDAKSPRLQVNPLSVMAPGIFRQIFEFD